MFSEHDEHFKIRHLKAKLVAYELLISVFQNLTFVVCFDKMVRGHWSSAPEAKLVNKMSNFERLKLKVHMLQTLPLNVQF